MKTLILIPFLAFVISFCAFNQEADSTSQGITQNTHFSSIQGKRTLGMGLGLQYGGLGGRFGINIANNVGIFAGMGYQLVGLGYNFGLKVDLPSTNMTQLYLVGMYGTNAVIKIEEYVNDLKKTSGKKYTGITFGVGFKFNSKKTEGNYLDIGLLIPIRSSAFKDAMTELENNPAFSKLSSPWPVLINVGFNLTMMTAK